MYYSVIYDFDVPLPCRTYPADRVSVKHFKPPHCRKLWECTESGVEDGKKHRKYTAILNQEQFDEFVKNLSLAASSIETMGSIGAPGYGFGLTPAICFEGTDERVYQNAYVTPSGSAVELAEFLKTHGIKPPMCLTDLEGQGTLWPDFDNPDIVWKLLRRVIVDKYGD